MPELPQEIDQDEQEIIDMFEEIRTTRDPERRIVLIKLANERLKAHRDQGKTIHKVAAFFKERAEKAREQIAIVGEQISKCCGE